MKSFLAFISGCSLVLVLAGCQTQPKNTNMEGTAPAEALVGVTVTNRAGPELLKPTGRLFTLGPGDQLEIETLGEANSYATVTVGLDGKIYYYLLPGLDVWGLTLAQAKERIEKEMARFILTSPKVVLSLKTVSSHHIWVIGRLAKPGVYPLTGPTTLLESIALAGGPATSASTVTTEELADLQHSFVVRNGQLLPVNFYRLLRQGDMSQNIYLESDDLVFVPSTLNQDVYVLGAVKAPRAIAYSENLSLIAAIAGTQGTAKDAYLSHVAIVRGSMTEPQIIIVNYNDVVRGRASDVQLEPRDIVYVPLSPYRTLTRYLELIVNSFASTVAANEGTRFVSDDSSTVGVVSPVGTP